MTKILVATPLFPPEIGGPATYAHMLESELPKYGFEVEIVPFAAARRWPKIIRHFVYYRTLVKKSRSADVVYALDAVSVGWPAMWAAKRTKKTFLLRVPGDYAWEQGQIRFGVKDTLDVFSENRNQYSIFVRVLARLQSKVASEAELVVVHSEYMKSIVTTWGVHPANIVPIYSALFPLPVEQGRVEIRKSLGYKGTVIVSAGRLVPWKGFMTLIEILPELRKQVEEANLVIIGEGPDGARLRARAEELGVAEHVRFVPRSAKHALGAAIVGSDVFVLNTSYEGLSHQLLEVMALGVPIVTTNVGGNPELIKDTVTGILVPYDDKEELKSAIERAATHESFRDSLVRNARLRVKDFEKEKVIKELVNLLEKLS